MAREDEIFYRVGFCLEGELFWREPVKKSVLSDFPLTARDFLETPEQAYDVVEILLSKGIEPIIQKTHMASPLKPLEITYMSVSSLRDEVPIIYHI